MLAYLKEAYKSDSMTSEEEAREALALMEECAQLCERKFGAKNKTAITAKRYWGRMLCQNMQYTKAVDVMQACTDACVEAQGKESADSIKCAAVLGEALFESGRFRKAAHVLYACHKQCPKRWVSFRNLGMDLAMRCIVYHAGALLSMQPQGSVLDAVDILTHSLHPLRRRVSPSANHVCNVSSAHSFDSPMQYSDIT